MKHLSFLSLFSGFSCVFFLNGKLIYQYDQNNQNTEILMVACSVNAALDLHHIFILTAI